MANISGIPYTYKTISNQTLYDSIQYEVIREIANATLPTGGMAYGTELLPGLAFTADPDTGLYWTGSDSLGFSCAGSNQLTISTISSTFKGNLIIPTAGIISNGGNENITFSSNSIGLHSEGVKQLDINASRIQSTVNLEIPTAGVISNGGNENITFSSNSIGLYSEGVKQLDINASRIQSTVNLEIPTAGVISNGGNENITFSSNSLSLQVEGTNRLFLTASVNANFNPTSIYTTNSNALAIYDSLGSSKILSVDSNVANRYTMRLHAPIGTNTVPNISYIYLDNANSMYLRGYERSGDMTSNINFITLKSGATGQTDIYSTGQVLFNEQYAQVQSPSGGNTSAFKVNAVSGNTVLQVDTTNSQNLSYYGTESLPGYSFNGDSDTGIYRVSADNLGVSCAGGQVSLFNSTGITVPKDKLFYKSHGAASSSNDTREQVLIKSDLPFTSGIKVQSQAWISILDNHVGNTDGKSQMDFYVQYNDPQFDFKALSLLCNSTTSAQALFLDGTISQPSIGFQGDPNTGLYWIGADNIGITCGNAKQLDISTTGATFSKYININYQGGSSQLVLTRSTAANGGVFKCEDNSATTGRTGGVDDLTIQSQGGSNYINIESSGGICKFSNLGGNSESAIHLYGTDGTDYRQCFQVSSVKVLTESYARMRNRCEGNPLLPSYSFLNANELDTGMYLAGASTLGFSTNGTNQLEISTTLTTSALPIKLPISTASSPGLQFVGDITPSGLYHPAVSNTLRLAINGADTVQYESTYTRFFSDIQLYISGGAPVKIYDYSHGHSINFLTGSITYDASLNTDKHIFTIDDDETVNIQYQLGLTTKYGLFLQDGNLLSNLSLSFESDIYTGINHLAPNGMSFITNGAQAMAYDASKIYLNKTVEFTPATFAISNTTATNKIELIPASNLINLKTNNANKLTVGSSNITATVPYIAPVGSIGAPTYTFTGDTNTGLYWIGADNIGMSCGNSKQFDLNSTRLALTNNLYIPVNKGLYEIVNGHGLSWTSSAVNLNCGSGVGSISLTVGVSLDTPLIVSQSLLTAGVPIVHPIGSVSNPSLTFASELTTGLYKPSASNVAITCGGTQALNVNTSTITTPAQSIVMDSLNSGAGISRYTTIYNLTTTATQTITNFSCSLMGFYQIMYNASGDTMNFFANQAIHSGASYYAGVSAFVNCTRSGTHPTFTLTILSGAVGDIPIVLSMNTGLGTWTIRNSTSTTQSITLSFIKFG